MRPKHGFLCESSDVQAALFSVPYDFVVSNGWLALSGMGFPHAQPTTSVQVLPFLDPRKTRHGSPAMATRLGKRGTKRTTTCDDPDLNDRGPMSGSVPDRRLDFLSCDFGPFVSDYSDLRSWGISKSPSAGARGSGSDPPRPPRSGLDGSNESFNAVSRARAHPSGSLTCATKHPQLSNCTPLLARRARGTESLMIGTFLDGAIFCF